jgi:hypothetical protein
MVRWWVLVHYHQSADACQFLLNLVASLQLNTRAAFLLLAKFSQIST